MRFPGFLILILSLAHPLQASSPILEQQLKAGDWTFDLRVAGPEDGELVVLLHGFPQTSLSYRHQLTALAEAGYRAVAPDQRGYSPGARPEVVEAYATSHLAADVVAIVDALGHSQFHLVGHDWGGAVAWIVATRYPDRVRTLTVLSTPHFAAFGAALADPSSEQARRSSYFERWSADGAADRFLADDAALLRSLFTEAVPRESVDVYVQTLSQPGAMQAALNWYRALVQSRASGNSGAAVTTPPKIQSPTLYVWSTEDTAFAREVAEKSGQFVAGPYRFVVLESVSHWVPEEAPERVNQLLLEHLNSDSKARALRKLGPPRQD